MANEKLTWMDLRKSIAQMAGIGEQVTGLFMDALIDAIIEGLQKDGQVKIKGIGTFALKPMAARKSVNIATGEEFVIPGYNKLTFTPEATLKENVEKRIETPASSVLVEELTKDPLKKLGEQANEIVDILADLGQAPIAAGVGAVLASTDVAAEEAISNVEEKTVETMPENQEEESTEDSNVVETEETAEQVTEETTEPVSSDIAEAEEEEEEITDNIMEEIEEVIEETTPETAAEPTEAIAQTEEEVEEETKKKKKRGIGKKIFWWTFYLLLLGSMGWGYMRYKDAILEYKDFLFNSTDTTTTPPEEKPAAIVIVEKEVKGVYGSEIRIDTIINNVVDTTTNMVNNDTVTTTDVNADKVSLADQSRTYTKFLCTERVAKDSRLALISKRHYGHIDLWVFIYEANRDQIKTPSSIEIGQELRIPDLDDKYRNLEDPELRKLVDKLIKEYDK
jgi:nucleoid DNA-binding protein/outer membrane biosynthesis protein TonB